MTIPPSARIRHVILLIFLIDFATSGLGALGLEWPDSEHVIKVKPGETVATAIFHYRNVGRVPILIKAATPTCDCLDVAISKNVVSPGESGEIAVKFGVAGREGKYERSVIVEEDDPSVPKKVLKVTYDLPEPARLETRMLWWEAGSTLETKHADVVVDNASLSTVTAVQSDTDAFAVSFEKLEEGRRYAIKVTPRSTTTQIQSTVRITFFAEGIKRVLVLLVLIK